MRFPVAGRRFFAFFPPYRTLEPLEHPSALPRGPRPIRGGVVVWNLAAGDWGAGFRAIRDRPPGVALFLLVPPASDVDDTDKLLDLMEHCRPHSILSHQNELEPEELRSMLKRVPGELAVEVMDYLRWRGIEVDLDTRRLLRKTLELSRELRTVRGLARALYMSRRALGRRFMTRGLPVPSHWLHFGRVLRACLRLQNADSRLFCVGTEYGYPDGFALSNQMHRLTGLRPSVMRHCFGWEWIVESWLHREALDDNLSPDLRRDLFPSLARPAEKTAAAQEAVVDGRPSRVAEEGHGELEVSVRSGSAEER